MGIFKDSKKHSLSIGRVIKSLFFIALFIYITVVLIALIVQYTFARGQNILFGGIGIWLVIAYYTIPRIHRWLTKVYLPNYFIGRARTGDGLLSDPVNLTFIGTKKQIIDSMQSAGWVLSDNLSFKSTIKMIKSTVANQSYPRAPVSSLYLFSRKQDFTFQQEIEGTTTKRHHVRFWECPKGWYLPGGFKADWLAAATYDRKVGISAFTLQITHKIEASIDTERDFVLNSLIKSNKEVNVNMVKNYSSSYHDRNGGGDLIETDGSLPFIQLS